MPTVTRVLPWRRHSQPPAMEVQEIIAQFRRFHPKRPTDAITEAYRMAAGHHEVQLRRSGEPYITHPLAVAGIAARYGMDDVTIAAALLHDAVEDTRLELSEIDEVFGAEVTAIVDGLPKLERIKFESKEAQQAATMRKMLVAMAKDLRVLVIKRADRLHNMRTLAAMPAWKQERTAQETLDIYAPLAHRLGMQELKQQLEDLSFASLHPKRYAEIDHMVATRSPERDFDDIFDLIGIRVIVETVKDCYAALGSIHATWKPVQGRFKDYIAMPKFNLYQSLHTTVVGMGGKTVEVQIRTREMHQRAEFGVAAHYSYKGDDSASDMPWLNRIIDWQQETSDPSAFMETLKVDLDQDEVYVFTPKGQVMTMPNGATPIDFAYSIHTEVGHACIGARVNGRLVPLDSKLTSGDTVEIFTSKVEGAGPSRDWLQIVATPRAANKIRQWFSRERREDAIDNGREELIKALRREGLPVQKCAASHLLAEVATSLNYADLDALHASIGENHVSAKSVASRIAKELRDGEPEREEQLPTTVRQPRARRERPAIGVHVEGLDDVMVRLSRCCTPVPGDEIMGFVTRGRGVSVHRADCANAVSLAGGKGERLIEVEWDTDITGMFVASIEVKALDRARLLSDVAKALSDQHVNILTCASTTGADRISKMRFDFELGDASHLDSVVSTIKRIESVYDAYRIVPGKGG